MLFMRKTSVDSERKRGRKKNVSIFKSNTLGYCFCNQKTRFFFQSPSPTPPPFFFFFLLLHLQHLQDKIAKLRGQSRFIIVMQKKLEMQPQGEVAEFGGGSRESEEEGGKDKEKKVAQTFDVAATNLPCDRRYMGAINELYQPLHMQSDDSGQGVNWILTGRSDTPGPRR